MYASEANNKSRLSQIEMQGETTESYKWRDNRDEDQRKAFRDGWNSAVSSD